MSNGRQGEPSWKSRFPFSLFFGPEAGKPNVGKMKAEGNIFGLIDLLDYNSHRDYGNYWAAQTALIELGAPAVEPLLHRLGMVDEQMRVQIGRVLGQIADPRGVEPLLHMTKERNVALRQTAVIGLGNSEDPRAIAALCDALLDEEPYVRELAEKALEKRADARIVAPLVRQAHSPKASTHTQTLLRLALSRAAGTVSPDDLRQAARLNDSYVLIFAQAETSCSFTTYNVTSEACDFSQIKQLARQELIRRGLEA